MVSPLAVRLRFRRTALRLRAQTWRWLHPGIEVGAAVRVGSGVRLFLDSQARLVLGAGCEIDDGATIAVYGTGVIRLGPRSFIGHRCTLAAQSLLEIGEGTYLAELVSVRDHDHAVGPPPSSGQVSIEPVLIGADVWIATKVTVLRGARIGDNTVVGANAVVRGELPPRVVAAGIPARVLREIDASESH
jgi:acetyltransferase-like isoleucine patch superfamily enzyme